MGGGGGGVIKNWTEGGSLLVYNDSQFMLFHPTLSLIRNCCLPSLSFLQNVPRLLGGPITLCLAMTSLAFASRPRSLADLSESATNGVYPSSESDVIFGSEKNAPSTFKITFSFDNG